MTFSSSPGLDTDPWLAPVLCATSSGSFSETRVAHKPLQGISPHQPKSTGLISHADLMHAITDGGLRFPVIRIITVLYLVQLEARLAPSAFWKVS
jgi:hypothetical protein